MVDQYGGLDVGEEQLEKDRLTKEMIEARRKAARQYEQGIADTRTAMDQGNIRRRQFASGGLGRGQGFLTSGGGAQRGALEGGLNVAGEIARSEEIGTDRLMQMGVNLADLEVDASTAARSMMKTDERKTKMEKYMDAYNKAYAAQGVDGAKAAVDAMLVFETDPVVVDRVQHMMTVQELID
tara:strand:+ start:1328 stop:1873 length:546 start_codon:yes stop_codon:yes gene_type:complete